MKNTLNKQSKNRPSLTRNSSKIQWLTLKRLDIWSEVLLLLLSDFSTKHFCVQMIGNISALWRHNGSTFTVLYLKEAVHLVTQTISGHASKSTYPGGIRVATRRGLPLIIPGQLRYLIEANHVPTLRIVLSILNVFRLIKCTPVLKINTITDPFTGVSRVLSRSEIVDALVPLAWRSVKLRANAQLLNTVSVGPNFKVSGLGAVFDAYAFKYNYPGLIPHLERICCTTGPELWSNFQKELRFLPKWLEKCRKSPHWIKSIPALEELRLGKLSKKLEAAGKVRIFAITDLWTQSALKPLHDYLFNILKIIPQDGTFDQLGPLRRLKLRGRSRFWSFDLSAATDRLPVDVQAQVIGILLGEPFADAWKSLLTERPWFLSGVPYQYSVGQPMGALSSWASLALTHHLIVQIAARRSGLEGWFEEYAILGDDIVIAHEDVAKTYLSLMKFLGVPINMSKSLPDSPCCEFAKRLLGPEGDVSPIPPKLILLVANNPLNLVGVVREMVSRGVSINQARLSHFIAKVPGHQRLPKDFIWNLTGPVGFLNLLGLSPFLGNKSLKEDQLETLVIAVDQVVNRHLVKSYYKSLEETLHSWETLTKFLKHPWIDMFGDAPKAGMFGSSNIPFLAYPEETSPDQSYFAVGLRKRLAKAWERYSEPRKVIADPNYLVLDAPSSSVILRLIEKKVSKQWVQKPNLCDWQVNLKPLGITNESVYNYLVETLSRIDGPVSAVPELLSGPTDTKPTFSTRFKIYKELESAFIEKGIDKFIEVKHLPELGGDPDSSTLEGGEGVAPL